MEMIPIVILQDIGTIGCDDLNSHKSSAVGNLSTIRAQRLMSQLLFCKPLFWGHGHSRASPWRVALIPVCYSPETRLGEWWQYRLSIKGLTQSTARPPWCATDSKIAFSSSCNCSKPEDLVLCQVHPWKARIWLNRAPVFVNETETRFNVEDIQVSNTAAVHKGHWFLCISIRWSHVYSEPDRSDWAIKGNADSWRRLPNAQKLESLETWLYRTTAKHSTSYIGESKNSIIIIFPRDLLLFGMHKH
jgi:hypothetical protein